MNYHNLSPTEAVIAVAGITMMYLIIISLVATVFVATF